MSISQCIYIHNNLISILFSLLLKEKKYICSKIEHMKDNEDHFEILRKIGKKPETTQRELAKGLGFSLGKLNYCLRELQKKGFVKVTNFKNNKNKFNYFYILTPRGISQKTKLTINFMKRKMKEYDELKKEI